MQYHIRELAFTIASLSYAAFIYPYSSKKMNKKRCNPLSPITFQCLLTNILIPCQLQCLYWATLDSSQGSSSLKASSFPLSLIWFLGDVLDYYIVKYVIISVCTHAVYLSCCRGKGLTCKQVTVLTYWSVWTIVINADKNALAFRESSISAWDWKIFINVHLLFLVSCVGFKLSSTS